MEGTLKLKLSLAKVEMATESTFTISAVSVIFPETSYPVNISIANCSTSYCCRREKIYGSSLASPNTPEENYVLEVETERLTILEGTEKTDMPGLLAQISNIEANTTEGIYQVEPGQRLMQLNFGKIKPHYPKKVIM